MIDEADRAAIKIMATAADVVSADDAVLQFERWWAIKFLHHSVRHLAYPDRAIYPKVRGSKKSDPVSSRRKPWM